MKITPYFKDFINQAKYCSYKKIVNTFFLGVKEYSLPMQPGYEESDYLPPNIKECVRRYTGNKDIAICMFEDFVSLLKKHDIEVDITFPPIPVSNTFERLMFIAKYMQEKDSRIEDLEKILWVSPRTVEEDLRRLKGETQDPIQVCGRQFRIEEMERENGQIAFSSTAHPLFLVENLTQVIVMLKGLKKMAEDPLYRNYAVQSASEIWNQLSRYAKNRIRYVFSELLPEELEWYQSLKSDDTASFHSERFCSRVSNEGPGVLLMGMKTGQKFCVEYETEEGPVFYTDCSFIPKTFRSNPESIEVECSAGRKTLLFSCVIRSAFLIEELAAN